MPDSDRPLTKQAPLSTEPSPSRANPDTRPSQPGSLKRSLPDGRTVEVFLPGSQGYEEASALAKSYQSPSLNRRLPEDFPLPNGMSEDEYLEKAAQRRLQRPPLQN